MSQPQKKKKLKRPFEKRKEKRFRFSDYTKKNLNCKSNSLTQFLSKIFKLSQNFFFSNILCSESGINKSYRKNFETGFFKNRKLLLQNPKNTSDKESKTHKTTSKLEESF